MFLQRFNGLAERSRNYLTSWNENSRISGRMGGLNIQGQQQNIQFGRSIRITLLLVLSIFLIGQCQTYIVLHYEKVKNYSHYMKKKQISVMLLEHIFCPILHGDLHGVQFLHTSMIFLFFIFAINSL